jgi:DNA topoisomerase I
MAKTKVEVKESAKTTAKPSSAKTATKKKATKTATKAKAKSKATKAKLAKVTKAEAKVAPPKKPGSKRAKGGTGKSLVIVESPAKAKTIKKYLGAGYVVKASVGHIKDLPKSKMGVDVEKGFKPLYVVIKKKEKVLEEIRKAAEKVDRVYLAADPDREGEAIAWHIAEEIADIHPTCDRVLINEITKKGVTEAISKPIKLDNHKYDAQQARRILDRLVGYQISPILWDKVKRGLSAGRVQSVAVRLIVERDREISAFIPEEYWSVDADVEGKTPPPFLAKLFRWDGEKIELKNKADADRIVAELAASKPVVEAIDKNERKRNPPRPFITSTLQQEAARKLRFTARKTMAFAQRLYEGVDLGEEGPTGLITYMRTDSVRLSDDALTEVRAFINDRFGKDYLPAEPIVHKVSKQAQGAHEAIRPTSMRFDPETVRKLLLTPLEGKDTSGPRGVEVIEKREEAEGLVKLYALIWNRFVSCQMTPAVYDQTAIDIKAGRVTLRANGKVMKFAGFTQVYVEAENDDEAAQKAEEQDKLLPPVAVGDVLKLGTVRPEQHFTQPPPRFTEASLVKELEEKGIGRPSTYASIMSTIQDRGYIEKRESRFFATELGTLVNDLLVDAFPDILNVEFTREMEERLDKVEEGTDEMVKVLGNFYKPFKVDLDKAVTSMRDVKREEIPTDFTCELCGGPMVIKWGKNGNFLACKSYPECKNTKDFKRAFDGTIEIVQPKQTDMKCETCGSPMKVKKGRFGEFLACSTYPECQTTMPISLGVTCPKEGCGGYLTEKRSRRGRVFYGCANYSKTKCDFVAWDKPIPEECPQCQAKFLTKRETKRGATVRCMAQGCGYLRREGEGADEADVA